MITENKYIKAFLLPAFSYVILAGMLTYSRFFLVGEYFFQAVIIDLVITVPVIYLIASWKFKTKISLVFPLITFGFAAGYFLMPSQHSLLVLLRNYFAPLLEVISLATVSYYAFKFYRETKSSGQPDALYVIKTAVNKVLGNSIVSAALITEFAVVYYSLFAWKKRASHFTCYKTNSTLIIYGFIVFIVLAETIAFHFLFIRINIVFAWIVFATSLYFALQLLAHMKAMIFRSTEFDKNQLIIRYGLAGDVTANYSQDRDVNICSDFKPDAICSLARLGILKSLEPYNIIIEFNEPVLLESFYGRKKKIDVLLLAIDEKEAFVKQLKENIG